MSAESEPRRRRKRGRLVYFSDEEMDLIAQRMRKAGLTNFSEFARELLTTGTINVTKSDTKSESNRDELLSDLLREVNAIGVNLNQIARKVNTDSIINEARFDQLLELNSEVRALIKDELGNQNGRGKDRLEDQRDA